MHSLFAEASRIIQNDYTPTEIDVVHARASTTGVHEITFGFRRFSIRLIDVGGQKTERRKWIHCFENVTAILFVIALSSFDQWMEEDPDKNRLEDSVELFNSMYHNEFLRKCSFILFLNKKDIFEEKLRHVSLSKFFPGYAGDNTFSTASDFIRALFVEAQQDDSRHIYTHFTNATDTNNIDIVFGATCDIILQHNLSRAGMS
jgi:GTPase SAR1 family protein